MVDGINRVAEHPRNWGIGQDILDEKHRKAVLKTKKRAVTNNMRSIFLSLGGATENNPPFR